MGVVKGGLFGDVTFRPKPDRCGGTQGSLRQGTAGAEILGG